MYDSTRVSRTDAEWMYVGVTHEYMTSARKGIATTRAVDPKNGPRPFIKHDLSHSDPNKKRKR